MAEPQNQPETTNEDLQSFYSSFATFVNEQVKRVQQKKGDQPLTYKDYQLVDNLNVTGTAGLTDFLRDYSPGPVVDIGAGFGAACRVMQEEFGYTPIGIDYIQENVDLGNYISRQLGLPEVMRQGDASQPMGVENADGAVCYSVLNALPRNKQVDALRCIKDCLKPGAHFWLEDLTFARPATEFHPDHKALMEDNPQMNNTIFFDEFRGLIEEAGWEVVQQVETTQINAEACWQRANDIYLPLLETEGDSFTPVEKKYYDFITKNKPKLYHDLKHLSLEQIRARFPRTCEYTEPQHYCFDLELDVRMLRFVLRKPLQ